MSTAETTQTTAACPNQVGWNVFRWFIAGVLLIAAGLKAWHVTTILASEGLLSDRSFLYAVIGFEAAAACYIAFAQPFRAWLVAVLTFAGFTVVSAYALLSDTACNCFGEQIGPKFTLPLDIGIVVFSLMLRPRRTQPAVLNNGPLLAAMVCSSLLVAAAAHLQTIQQSQSQNAANLQFLLADQQTGQPWPLPDSLHPALKEMQQGRWLAFVLRQDCDHCRQLISDVFEDPSRHRSSERTAVFIAGQSSWPFQFDAVSFDVSDSQRIDWPMEPFVASPAVFVIENGTVTAAVDGSESDAFVRQLFVTD